MKATAIIGMNFGDEGKGHIVNFLSNDKTLNVRFNGGAQAAHAVFLSDGRSHIFHQFGAGSLRGARTLFASHFILNPIFFMAELSALYDKAPLREVFVDPRCRVTTPYDMFINEFSSYHRRKNDTTGFGINETVERSQFRQLRLSVRDLIDKNEKGILSILNLIQHEYTPWRLEKLHLPYDEYMDFIEERGVNEKTFNQHYMDMIKGMLKFIVVWPDDNLIERYLQKESGRQIIFEGAQGFRLDQDRKKLMPYLTRSSTGLKNVFDCLRNVKMDIDLDVCMVTRAYLTRHGDGPLWNEVKRPYNDVKEPTNVPNSYQGTMRYGYLNKTWYDTALDEIQTKIEKSPKCVSNVNVYIAFTCLDHLNGDNLMYSNGGKDFVSGDITHFDKVEIVSNGVTEKHCKMVD